MQGTRFISTSATVLYDGHHNFQGVLSLARDVTVVRNLEEKYRRVRNWLIPSLLLLGFLVALLFFTYPFFFKGYQIMDERKHELKNQLAKDYLLLKSLVTDPFEVEDRTKTSQLLKDFFAIQEATSIPYNGLILLDKAKKVFYAHSTARDSDAQKMVGSSYLGIEFQESENSSHKVLTLFRADKEHPMGAKGIEIAFEIKRGGNFLGWLIFQMDVELLEQKYAIDEETLKKFQFQSLN